MVSPEIIAQAQEQPRKLAPEHLEQLREVLRLKANEGEPDYSHHFTPEALARAELASSQKIKTELGDAANLGQILGGVLGKAPGTAN